MMTRTRTRITMKRLPPLACPAKMKSSRLNQTSSHTRHRLSPASGLDLVPTSAHRTRIGNVSQPHTHRVRRSTARTFSCRRLITRTTTPLFERVYQRFCHALQRREGYQSTADYRVRLLARQPLSPIAYGSSPSLPSLAQI